MNGDGGLAAKELEKVEPFVFIDVGCRFGFANRFLETTGPGSIKFYGFDPDANECARLNNIYRAADLPIVCVPVALSESAGRRELFVTQQPACSSFHPPLEMAVERYPALSELKVDRVELVPTQTLADWAEATGLSSVDYLKLDTQGSELEVLRGMGELLQTVKCIDLEVEFSPLYNGQSLFGETDSFLRSKGFSLWRFFNLVHYALDGDVFPIDPPIVHHFDTKNRSSAPAFSGQLFWADARYVRHSVIAADRSDASIRRDIALFEVLDIPDITRALGRTLAQIDSTVEAPRQTKHAWIATDSGETPSPGPAAEVIHEIERPAGSNPETERLLSDLTSTRADLAAALLEIEKVKSSTVWRVTRPLCRIVDLAKRAHRI